MNIHKIILAVLAAAMIAVGATTVTVHADGPNINGFMDTATTARFQQMTPAWQGMVGDAWGFVTTIAPRDDWDEAAAQIVSQMYEDARRRGKLRGSSPAPSFFSSLGALLGFSRASSSCDASGSTTLGSSGYAASSTTSTCRKDFMTAQTSVQGGPGDLRSCFGCTSVHAYVNGLSCRYYNVVGHHEWGYNPSGRSASFDSGHAGC